MPAHLVAILVLVGVFLVGTVRSINLGVLALVGAFGVGSLVFGAPRPTSRRMTRACSPASTCGRS